MGNQLPENSIPETLRDQLIFEAERRLIREGLNRVKKSLAMLEDDEIWIRPNEHSNSVGNLILHLAGNVRQWILAGMGGQEDTRQREKEFSERGTLPAEILILQLEIVLNETMTLLQTLKPDDLVKHYNVQGFQESGTSIIVHVIEHFSYHVGQITYFVKAQKNKDTGYYRGIDLSRKSQS